MGSQLLSPELQADLVNVAPPPLAPLSLERELRGPIIVGLEVTSKQSPVLARRVVVPGPRASPP